MNRWRRLPPPHRNAVRPWLVHPGSLTTRVIARHDLRLRGPGELLGARQSGAPLLRFADLDADLDLLDAARAAAETLLRERPDVAQRHLARWFGARHEYLKA